MKKLNDIPRLRPSPELDYVIARDGRCVEIVQGTDVVLLNIEYARILHDWLGRALHTTSEPSALQAALREAMNHDWNHCDWPVPQSVVDQCNAALAGSALPPEVTRNGHLLVDCPGCDECTGPESPTATKEPVRFRRGDCVANGANLGVVDTAYEDGIVLVKWRSGERSCIAPGLLSRRGCEPEVQ